MTDYFMALVVVNLPVLSVCAGLLFWSARSASPRLASVLKYSALFWALVLTATLHFLIFVTAHCGGNFLKGWTACPRLPQAVAEASFPILLLSYAAAITYGAVLILIGSVVERRVRKARSFHVPKSTP